MPAIAVPVFALTWWAACYLVGRDPARPVLWRAAAALATFAAAVAVWTVWPGSSAAQILLCLPALLWAGTAVALLPDTLPERRRIDLGWLVLSTLFLVMVIALPPAGRLVALAPLFGALVLLWRFRDEVEPPMLPVALGIVAFLYGCGLVVLLLPIDLGVPALVLAAIGVDLLVLAFLVAVANALEAGERLRPDLLRAGAGAVAGTLVVGGLAALTMVAGGGRAVVLLQFALVAVVMAGIGLAGWVVRGLDRIAFLHDDRLRADRSTVLLLAAALPRRRERQRLFATREEDFLRFTRQALDHYGDLGRLMRSPLISLPAVDRRMRFRPVEQPLARALELQAVLLEGVTRLRPSDPLATTDDWRLYNVLYFCSVLGLQPHARRRSGPRSGTTGLDAQGRQALDWMRRYVPPRMLRRWQSEGATVVAGHLWDDLAGSDQRRVSRQVAEHPGATRST